MSMKPHHDIVILIDCTILCAIFSCVDCGNYNVSEIISKMRLFGIYLTLIEPFVLKLI